ncbi:adhesive plaque matrix protein 2-like [Stegodyphus dumicola]|uniref:adhesive plaque matrix protein 2-like n=1 Tax=Stegodyphus dumicola TaxID=202533 RepID=UPI0015B22CC2|nr:adhesive plaque matrix protein 2-like [Stegodyphus dumicola]
MCEDGFLEFDGQCKECLCGEGYVCSFDRFGNKNCECEDRFLEFNGTCKLCDCGRNGICTFNSQGRPKCTCRLGFKEYDFGCRDCYCGYDIKTGESINCSFDMYGYKRCECPDGYVDINGHCEASRYLFRCMEAICVRYDPDRGIACKCNDYKDWKFEDEHKKRNPEDNPIRCEREVLKIVTEVKREVSASAVFLVILLGVILGAFLVLAYNAFKKQEEEVKIEFIEKGKY